MSCSVPFPRHSRPSGLRDASLGQSTVEFMLMVPVLFAIFFFVIECSLYFTTVHYGTYAAFSVARAQQVGFAASGPGTSAEGVAGLILTGDVWGTAQVNRLSSGGSNTGIGIELHHFEQLVPFPFIQPLLPDMQLYPRAFLGGDERNYEYRAEARASRYFDNNL